MKVGNILFFVGLAMLMSGLYLSLHWTILGLLMVVIGGWVMGSSAYFFIEIKKNNDS